MSLLSAGSISLDNTFKVIFLVGEERAYIKPLRNLFILWPLQVIYIMTFEVADEWYRLYVLLFCSLRNYTTERKKTLLLLFGT